MRKFTCLICGYVYEESAGIPEKGIAPGTKWEDLHEDFACPVCGAPKHMFRLQEELETPAQASRADDAHAETHEIENLKELSAGEISAICSSLAKGCEKQRLNSEMEAFNKIADYFKAKTISQGKTPKNAEHLEDAAKMLGQDMAAGYSAANTAAKANSDRGALRSLVWSEKVSTMMKSLLERFAKEGDALLENTKIYVCDICGFIYLGGTLPQICPVCKVPNYKMIQVERR